MFLDYVKHSCLFVVLHEFVDLLHVAKVIAAWKERVQFVVKSVGYKDLVKPSLSCQLPAVLKVVVQLPRTKATLRTLG